MILDIFVGALLALLSANLAIHLGLRLADRMPGESLRPECLYCQRPAPWLDLLPIFGWLLRPRTLSLPCGCGIQRGQWAVPTAELLGMLLGGVSGAINGLDGETIFLALGVGLLPAIAIIDILFTIIPDALNVALAALGVAWLFTGDAALAMGLILGGVMLLLGLALAFGYSALRGKEMLGLGDVKFFAAAGLWLTPETLPWFLMLSGILGAGFGIGWRKAGGGEQSPFAPALVISLICCLFYQVWEMSFI